MVSSLHLNVSEYVYSNCRPYKLRAVLIENTFKKIYFGISLFSVHLEILNTINAQINSSSSVLDVVIVTKIGFLGIYF